MASNIETIGESRRTYRWLHSSHRLRDNSKGRILTLMREADFADPKTISHGGKLFWHIAYYQASVRTSKAKKI